MQSKLLMNPIPILSMYSHSCEYLFGVSHLMNPRFSQLELQTCKTVLVHIIIYAR